MMMMMMTTAMSTTIRTATMLSPMGHPAAHLTTFHMHLPGVPGLLHHRRVSIAVQGCPK